MHCRQAYKILFISHEYPPFGGGAGVVAQDLCRNLARWYDITLLTKSYKNRAQESFNIVNVRVLPKLWIFSYLIALLKIRLDSYDCIILNDIGAALSAGVYLSRTQLKRTILIMHGSEPENLYSQPRTFFKVFRFDLIYNRIIRNVSHIVAVSDYMKAKAKEAIPSLRYCSNMKVIANGVDQSIFYRIPVIARELLGVDKQSKVVISVSRIDSKKGYSRLYRILKPMLEKNPGFYWWVVGDGPYLSTLKARAALDNLEKRIIFRGYVPRDQLKLYYSAADLFILLSDYDESFGLVYLEANLAGCPVIGNMKAGVAEVIKESVNGFALPVFASDTEVRAKIEEIISCKKMSPEAISLYAKKYSIENTVASYKGIIDNIVNSR